MWEGIVLTSACNAGQSFEGGKKNTNTVFQEVISLQKGSVQSVKAVSIKVVILKYFLIWDFAITNNSNDQNGVLIWDV